MTHYDINLERHVFTGHAPGPHLVVFARIHGNEPSGEIATRQIIQELQSGTLRLTKGRLILFPLLNPLAKEKNVRDVWGDTNRGITQRTRGSTPEDHIKRAIVGQLIKVASTANRQKQIWHALDLHSVPLQPGIPHTILSEGRNDLSFARAVGAEKIYTGWRSAYQFVDEDDLRALGSTRQQHIDYTSALIYSARDAGAATSICFESGQNDDPQSVRTAYQGIRNALAYHGLTDEPILPFVAPDKHSLLEFKQVLIRRDVSEHLVDIYSDAQPLKPGQVILRGKDGGRVFTVPQDGANWFIAHPIPNAKVGQHFGFLAQKVG